MEMLWDVRAGAKPQQGKRGKMAQARLPAAPPSPHQEHSQGLPRHGLFQESRIFQIPSRVASLFASITPFPSASLPSPLPSHVHPGSGQAPFWSYPSTATARRGWGVPPAEEAPAVVTELPGPPLTPAMTKHTGESLLSCL